MSSRAGSLAFAFVALLLSALFIGLGLWQLERLEQRRDRNAERRARLEQPRLRIDAAGVGRRLGAGAGPPADAGRDTLAAPDEPTEAVGPVTAAPFPPLDSAAWRRATLEGRFDYAREAVLAPRSSRGSPAVYLVTPLVVAESAAVAVLRGSVPAPDGLHGPLARARPVWARSDSSARGSVTADRPGRRPGAPRIRVHGSVHRPADEPVSTTDTLMAAGGAHPVLSRLDLARLDALWPWHTAPFYVRADSTGERIPAVEGLALPRPVPPPELGDGPHLAYAIQWFAFAAIVLVGGTIFLWRRGA